MKLRTFILSLIVSISALAAQAFEYERLATHGHWHVDLNISSDGSLSCSVFNSWYNRNTGVTQTMEIDVDSRGFYIVQLSSDAWQPTSSSEEITVNLKFGKGEYWHQDWELFGYVDYIGEGSWAATILLGEDPYQRDFVRDFMANDAAAVFTPDDRKLLFGFGLDGSSAAIRDMDECRAYIMAEPT